MYAAVAYIRAAASRAGVPVRQACQEMGEPARHDPRLNMLFPLPISDFGPLTTM
jgi:hypothetical protein